jgi:hypothetical protein
MGKITSTTHLKLSEEKLNPIPACKGGIMGSLRFSKFIKPWPHEKDFSYFEYQGLVSTQPKTEKAYPELWTIEKDGYFKNLFLSFEKSLLAGCRLSWKSQKQIEKFCEKNPEILKKYSQGVYFLIHRCKTDDLYLVKVQFYKNYPRFSSVSINFGSGVLETNHGTDRKLHCIIVPETWRKTTGN